MREQRAREDGEGELSRAWFHFDVDPSWYCLVFALAVDDEGSHAERNRSIHDENGAGILE